MRIIVGKNRPTMQKMHEHYNVNTESVHKFKISGNVWRSNFRKRVKGYKPNLTNESLVIRWGFGGDIPEGNYSEINKGKAILRASNKRIARRVMKSAGVPIPETWEDTSDILSLKFPLIARPERHQSGANLKYIDSALDMWKIPRSWANVYLSRYYPKTKEYRAHVAHGKILVMQEKVGATSDDVIWNHARTGCEFIPVKWSDYRVDVCKAAISAVEALGLNFGAVDIMADPTDDQPSVAVCEVNTAPSMVSGDYVMERYYMYFKWLEREGGSRECWDTSELTKGKSFAWKNWQLRDECKPSERVE